MTRLERLRREIVALAESLPHVAATCVACIGQPQAEAGTCGRCGNYAAPHPLAAPLRGIAWSLLPREERYREPEHGGGPLTSGDVNVNKAASELATLTERLHMYGNHTEANRLFDIAAELLTAVVQARPGETLDDVLRREGLSLSEPCEHCDGVGVEDNHEMCCQCAGSGEAPIEQTCGACVGVGGFEDVDGWRQCSDCTDGRVVAEDAIEVRVAGQVRYARRMSDDRSTDIQG